MKLSPRRRWSLGAILLVLAVVTAAIAWARSPLLFRGTGGPAPPAGPQTISSITQFTSSTTFTANTPNAVIGTVTVTMNPATPPFGGTLSITGTNSCGFQLSGGTQVQAGASGCSATGGPHGNGLYDDWSVVATQTGISPFTQPEAATAVATAPPPVLPSARDASANWKMAGLQSLGGIPSRTNICATVNPIGGGADDTGAIQSAINSCGTCPTYSSSNNCVVSLGAGTFTLSGGGPIFLNKSVVLRGQGAGITTIDRTNGAIPGNFTGGLINNARLGGGYSGVSAPILLTSDAAKGDTTIHVASTAAIPVGSLVNLDELGLGQPMADCCFNTNGQVWASSDYRYEWNAHNPAVTDGNFDSACYDNSNFTNGGNCAAGGNHSDATGYSIRGGGVMEEEHLVSAVNASANTITFDSPLTISFRTANSAAVEVFAAGDIVRFAGIENLTMSRGGDGGMQFQGCIYCWAKGIENYHYYNPGVHFVQGAFRDELTHSWLHNGAWPVNGGGGYSIGLTYGSSEILIDDNISMKANKVIVMRASGAGSVVSYNYMDDGYIKGNAGWIETGPANSHLIGSHHALFEGNVAFNTDSDFTHGASTYATYFGNWFTGIRATFTGEYDGIVRNDAAGCCSPRRALSAHPYSYRMSAIGNILGTAGVTTTANGWVYSDNGGSGGNSGAPSMLKLGWNDFNSGTTPSNKDDVMNTIYPADPRTIGTTGTYATANGCMSDSTNPCTTIVADNYDYVTGTIHNPETIPNSLYLTGPPPFWGSGAWPPFNPVGPVLSDIPAHQRFLSCSPVSDNSSSASCLLGTGTAGIACDIGPPYTGTIPAAASSAGFTHCAANYDFSSNVSFSVAGNGYTWSNINGWLDCKGAAVPLWWNLSYATTNPVPCARYSIISDSAFGTNVLQSVYLTSDWGAYPASTSTELDTTNSPSPTPGTSPGFFFPTQFYVEDVEYITAATQNGAYSGTSCGSSPAGIFGVWTWAAPVAVETDFMEHYPGLNKCTNGGNTIDHTTADLITSLQPSNVGAQPGQQSGYDPTIPHNYGTLQTASGLNFTRCNYMDGTQLGSGCVSATFNTGADTSRSWLKITIGPESNAAGTQPLVTEDHRLQRITVWECAGYATGHC